MTLWIAIAAVALGSYAFRVVPFLLSERIRLSDRADEVLRHAAAAAMTAMLVTGVMRLGADSSTLDAVAIVVAVATSSVIAFLGRSMALVIASGITAFVVATVLVGLSTG